jgi:hypothetical protein
MPFSTKMQLRLGEIAARISSPEGFIQTIPEIGAPPQLIEGRVYNVGGPAINANGGEVRFTLRDGKAIEITQSPE